MECLPRHTGDVVILTLEGTLNFEGAKELRRCVGIRLAQGERQIVLDMRQVSFMDSDGRRELIQIRTTCSSREAELKLLGPTGEVLELLEFSQLTKLFRIFTEQDEAVESFAAEAT